MPTYFDQLINNEVAPDGLDFRELLSLLVEAYEAERRLPRQTS
jgi:hypothetical protein